MIDNSKKSRSWPATILGLRPGDFPVGSPRSRAAARMLLKAAEHPIEEPPDARIVFDLPKSGPGPTQNIVQRYVHSDEVVEMVFPAHAYEGECLGVCEISASVSVEEALRLLREHREARALNQGRVQ
ncbi:MAG TPA: hypothetical protein VIX91_25265 [Candidatus Acidoferrum sp.]